MNHKAGFVSIIGKPNSGKSTLINALVEDRLAITTPKPQTTRHRIMGILNDPNYQIVLSDTPGIIEPKYELQKCMMKYVNSSFKDADIIIFISDIISIPDKIDIINKNFLDKQKILVLNKIDLHSRDIVEKNIKICNERFESFEIIAISALKNINIECLKSKILEYLPLHPPYFDKSIFTTQSKRFMVSEIIREKIMLNYKQEIPHCCQVEIYLFKEHDDHIKIDSLVFVERPTQKSIIIGKNGEKIKSIISQSTLDIQKLLNKPIILNIHLKVNKNWRNDINKLKKYKYK